MPIGHLHFLFGKMTIQFCPFLNQVIALFDAEMYVASYIFWMLTPYQSYLQMFYPIQ